jgi:hypothetical protein
VRDRRRGEDLDRLERRIADVLQQPFARSEDDRDDVQAELVEQAGRQVLVDRAGAAGNRDVLVAGGRAGPRERGLDPVGDEVERRAALDPERLALLVAERELRAGAELGDRQLDLLTRVSQGRGRYPLRCVIRSRARSPSSAPTCSPTSASISSHTTNATLSRNTSACSERMICSTASRAAVVLWPSAIVVLVRQVLAEPTILNPRGLSRFTPRQAQPTKLNHTTSTDSTLRPECDRRRVASTRPEQLPRVRP